MDVFKKFVAFWDSDRSLTALLALLVLAIFVLPVLPRADNWRDPVMDVVITLTLLSGIRVVSKNRFQTGLLSVFVAIALLFRVLSYRFDGQGVYILRSVSNILSLSILAVVVMTQVFRKGPITIHRIQGAVAEYLLLGLIWESAYELLEVMIPGAIQIGGQPIPVSKMLPDLLYFSFVTLTTVGYGDVTPVHAIARSMAILEALTGQLFPAILIARLVSMELISASKKYS